MSDAAIGYICLTLVFLFLLYVALNGGKLPAIPRPERVELWGVKLWFSGLENDAETEFLKEPTSKQVRNRSPSRKRLPKNRSG